MTGEGRLSGSFLCADEGQTPERYPGPEQLHLELHALRSQLESTVSPGGLIGVSLRMRTIHNLIDKARDRTFPVIILGETGTGKELVARCIHNSGSRNHSPFVAVDCSSLTPALIESELFGHIRGAFTGAETNKKGLVEAANTGTLFVDEIGELPRELQAKLLRVIQEKEVRPLGSTDAKPVNAHLLRASDGAHYVTKFMNNPQHVRVLANEMLATNLGLRLGLPMPRVEVIDVSDRLIENSDDLRVEWEEPVFRAAAAGNLPLSYVGVNAKSSLSAMTASRTTQRRVTRSSHGSSAEACAE
jgi:hypothetical protein